MPNHVRGVRTTRSGGCLRSAGLAPAYVIAWVADDPAENDGDATRDGSGEDNPGAGIRGPPRRGIRPGRGPQGPRGDRTPLVGGSSKPWYRNGFLARNPLKSTLKTAARSADKMRSMPKSHYLLGPAFVLLLSSVTAAQNLADVARAEEARRKTIKATGKVYTNDSLRGPDGGEAPAPPPVATTPASGGDAKPATPAPERPGARSRQG